MASTFTPNIHAELIGTGDLAGTWGAELNVADFTVIDSVFGAVQTLSLSSSDITVSTTQSQCNFIKLTGVLTANVSVIFPAIGRSYFIQNATTGAFSVTLKITGGVIAPQGSTGVYVLDGTNVVAPTPQIGTQASIASASTTDLGLVGTHNALITGTNGISSFGSTASSSNPLYIVTFQSALTLTHSSALILPNYANLNVAPNAQAFLIYLGGGNWVMPIYIPSGGAAFPIFGNGRFVASSSTVATLVPYQGNQITFPSGVTAAIPSSGIATTINNAFVNGTSGQTLAASTLYYAYLWNSGSAGSPSYVIDWSTTGHSTDAGSGIEIKTGDPTRVLIGAAEPQSGPVFADSASNRLVASWFNRQRKNFSNKFSTIRSVSTNSFTEFNTEIRCNFFSWGDSVSASFSGSASDNSSGPSNYISLMVSLNGATTNTGYSSNTIQGVAQPYNMSQTNTFALTEGIDYITVLGKTDSGTMNVPDTAGVGTSVLGGTIVN